MLKANTDFYLLNRFHVTDACQLTTGFCENKTRGGFTRQLAKGTKFCSPLFHAVNGETTSTRSAIRSAKLDLYRAARMVTAKIKISVKGAAIFSRKQLPPCFEYRLQPASEDCGPRKTRPLKTTPHGVLAHYWFVFRTLLWRDIGCVEGWTAVPTFYVNTADTQGSQMADQNVISRGLCLILIDRYQLRFVESLIGRLGPIGHPLLRSCPIIWAICALRNRGASACGGGRKLKATCVSWTCLSAPTSELQSAGEGKKTSKVF